MSERWIRLIWDFRGEEAASMAEHHRSHLEGYAESHELPFETGVEAHQEQFQSAWIAVPEDRMVEVRDALRPQRGELHSI